MTAHQPILEALDGLPVLNLQVTFQAKDDLSLPVFAGSTFRGVLGHALKASACGLGGGCDECRRPRSCVYHYLFETEAPLDRGENRGSPEVPRPFILVPPGCGRVLPAGQKARLGLRLLGKGTEYLAYFLYALERSGQRGLGRDRNRFQVLEAALLDPEQAARTFYTAAERGPGTFHFEPVARPLSAWAEDFPTTTEVTLDFLTPTRMKFRGQLVECPDFHVLMRSLLRRLDLLTSVHGRRPLAVDFRSLVRKAEQIERVESHVHWLDWERQSSRQKRRIPIGGFVGEVCYRGDFTPFGPLLAAGRVVHIGKSTTFGMGGYDWVDS